MGKKNMKITEKPGKWNVIKSIIEKSLVIIDNIKGVLKQTIGTNLKISKESPEILWEYHKGDTVLIQPKRDEFVFEGTIIWGEQENGDRYITIQYKDTEWKNGTEILSGEDLKKLNEYFKTSEEYLTGNLVKVPYEGTVVVGTVNNWNREDWKVTIQIIGDNSIINFDKEVLDKYNKPEKEK